MVVVVTPGVVAVVVKICSPPTPPSAGPELKSAVRKDEEGMGVACCDVCEVLLIMLGMGALLPP